MIPNIGRYRCAETEPRSIRGEKHVAGTGTVSEREQEQNEGKRGLKHMRDPMKAVSLDPAPRWPSHPFLAQTFRAEFREFGREARVATGELF